MALASPGGDGERPASAKAFGPTHVFGRWIIQINPEMAAGAAVAPLEGTNRVLRQARGNKDVAVLGGSDHTGDEVTSLVRPHERLFLEPLISDLACIRDVRFPAEADDDTAESVPIQSVEVVGGHGDSGTRVKDLGFGRLSDIGPIR
jgi:hypothetical protein